MPAKSKKQRRLMAMARKSPKKIFSKNRDVLKMTKGQLRDYAAIKEKRLPAKKRSVKGR
jgi:hypothetical protein|tara:strand:+ start:3142 stop:3318 length:177 start_codon:yes stop_codon:yes gene_type:complete